jgi:type II secretory pathway component PulM
MIAKIKTKIAAMFSSMKARLIAWKNAVRARLARRKKVALVLGLAVLLVAAYLLWRAPAGRRLLALAGRVPGQWRRRQGANVVLVAGSEAEATPVPLSVNGR